MLDHTGHITSYLMCWIMLMTGYVGHVGSYWSYHIIFDVLDNVDDRLCWIILIISFHIGCFVSCWSYYVSWLVKTWHGLSGLH